MKSIYLQSLFFAILLPCVNAGESIDNELKKVDKRPPATDEKKVKSIDILKAEVEFFQAQALARKKLYQELAKAYLEINNGKHAKIFLERIELERKKKKLQAEVEATNAAIKRIESLMKGPY